MKLQAWFRLFYPEVDSVSLAEKIYSGLAALGAIGLIMLTSSLFLGVADIPWVVASMGASAVLLFAVPFGPLSQPWNLIVGHLVSGVIGITVSQLIPSLIPAAAIAVALSIFVMFVTRSLHPPGGATALTVIIGGDGIRDLGYQFLLTPLLVNIAVILSWALLVNNLISNRYYPNTLKSLKGGGEEVVGDDKVGSSLSISREDLKYALKEMNEFIDVSQDDLSRIFNISATHAHRRRMGEILCGEIMTSEVISAEYGDDVETLWQLMSQHRIHSIPILQANRQVIGIVTIADFLNQVKNEGDGSLATRLGKFLKRTPAATTDKPEYAGHVMTAPATVINENQHILDLFPIFYKMGFHHLPVVDDHNRLKGMITPKNLLAALHADIGRMD